MTRGGGSKLKFIWGGGRGGGAQLATEILSLFYAFTDLFCGTTPRDSGVLPLVLICACLLLLVIVDCSQY